VDEVIVSNALGGGGNPARLVALAAGLPDLVAGLSIDRQCVGGLDAILLARALVDSGVAKVVVAGGAESYSRRPIRLANDPAGGPAVAYDRPPFTPFPDRDPEMHQAAADLARRLGINREMMDTWAMESHAKALKYHGDLTKEIVTLAGLSADAFTRPLSPALAARARPLAGDITAANAAVAADAAAFVIVSDRPIGPNPLQILQGTTLGALPQEPGSAPLLAMQSVLSKAGQHAADLTMAEVMEAYAAQALACIMGAGLDPANVNPHGGALARGHPIGASGAILAVRLFHGLKAGQGLAAIAAAGGIGTALLVAR
jgi:acetyl-CoA C-acetyltransferase